jgi:hypothetical protein
VCDRSTRLTSQTHATKMTGHKAKELTCNDRIQIHAFGTQSGCVDADTPEVEVRVLSHRFGKYGD